MTQQPTWYIRPLQVGDVSEIVALFQRCFGREMSVTQYQWEVGGVYPDLPKAWVAVANGAIVGHYAGMLIPIWYKKSVQPVSIAVDAIVDPAYRRQGIFSALVKTACQGWTKAGVAYGMLLPNEKWGTLTAALGWTPLFPLRWHIRPLHLEGLLARKSGITALGKPRFLSRVWNRYWAGRLAVDKQVHMERVEKILPAFDHLWQKIAPDLTHTVVRDSAWLNWRYLTTPHIQYELYLAWRGQDPIGYLALQRQAVDGGQVALIADLFAHPHDDIGKQTMLALIMQQLIAEGVESVLGLAIPDTPLATLWRQAGGILNRGEFQTWFVPLSPEVAVSAVANPQDWLMTGGEFDVI